MYVIYVLSASKASIWIHVPVYATMTEEFWESGQLEHNCIRAFKFNVLWVSAIQVS